MFKKVAFLGTGGTIAGTAASASDNVGYQAAQVGVAQLLDTIAPLRAVLGGWEPVFEQVAQVDSKDMGWLQWAALAQRVQHHLGQPDVAAVIVTHGTDTLEETAYFLSRVLPPELRAKPVVLTCAMRPASSLVPDGPQNVLDAVAVAQSDQARGVLAVCAGTVHSARDVQKVHTYRLNAFDSGDAGPLGYVEEGAVRWLHACPTDHTEARVDWQRWSPGTDWPQVEIVMSYVGASGASVRALCAAPADGAPADGAPAVRGIVVAGTGNGTIHQDLERGLRDVQTHGVRIVRATRCAQGAVVAGAATGGFAHSQGLSAVKARVALMLELMVESESSTAP
ncbi:MAG: asparaginase [Burkholderiales bacterium]|nr:asparaginase [Burkholderiales bacterium]